MSLRYYTGSLSGRCVERRSIGTPVSIQPPKYLSYQVSSLKSRLLATRINPIALFAVYIVERAIYDDPATRNCRAEKYRQCAIQFTVLNFRHWLTGNWSDAFAAIYSECRFPEFGRLSARYASAALFVKLRNRVTPLSSDFRCTDVNRTKKKKGEENFPRNIQFEIRIVGNSKFSISCLTGIRSSSGYFARFVHREIPAIFDSNYSRATRNPISRG